jgi:hypothetical protein
MGHSISPTMLAMGKGPTLQGLGLHGRSLIFDFKTTYKQILDPLSYIIKFNENEKINYAHVFLLLKFII